MINFEKSISGKQSKQLLQKYSFRKSGNFKCNNNFNMDTWKLRKVVNQVANGFCLDKKDNSPQVVLS